MVHIVRAIQNKTLIQGLVKGGSVCAGSIGAWRLKDGVFARVQLNPLDKIVLLTTLNDIYYAGQSTEPH